MIKQPTIIAHRIVFARIARIAALVSRSPLTFVSVRTRSRLEILGIEGLYVEKLTYNWPADIKLNKQSGIGFCSNIAREPALRSHPLLKLAPFARSLAFIPAAGLDSESEVGITAINPKLRWPFPAETTTTLIELAMLANDALTELRQTGARDARRHQAVSGFDEAPELPLGQAATGNCGDFLLATLKRKVSIHSRKDTGFVTLRTWATPVKKYQIEALKIIKANEDHHKFVDAVASEIAEHVRKMYGSVSFSAVVPVPAGHSKVKESLSEKIARHLAQTLGIAYRDALAREHRKGSSHPRKNQHAKKPALSARPEEKFILLIDDVASSGRHIELAAQALREEGYLVTAVAWIGAT